MYSSNVEITELKEQIRKIVYRLELLKFYASGEALHKWEKACNFMNAKETLTEIELREAISPDELTLFTDSQNKS